MKFFKSKKGFTLIELLVALAIVAAISTLGIVIYTSSTPAARDARRKQDVRTLKVALDLYYKVNGRYPCTGDNEWLWSTAEGSWIVDKNNLCNSLNKIPLDSKYISSQPTDPKNNAVPFWVPGNYSYGYRGGWISSLAGCSQSQNGQYYVIGAQLENKNDPEGQVKSTECNGSLVNWPIGTFVLTSED